MDDKDTGSIGEDGEIADLDTTRGSLDVVMNVRLADFVVKACSGERSLRL